MDGLAGARQSSPVGFRMPIGPPSAIAKTQTSRLHQHERETRLPAQEDPFVSPVRSFSRILGLSPTQAVSGTYCQHASAAFVLAATENSLSGKSLVDTSRQAATAMHSRTRSRCIELNRICSFAIERPLNLGHTPITRTRQCSPNRLNRLLFVCC